MTILLVSLIPEIKFTTELLDGLYENSVFYGFALVITAVAQTMQHKLDLYHAIFVMQIMFSLNFVYAYGASGIHFLVSFAALTRYGDAGMRRYFQSSKNALNALRATLVIAVQLLSTTVFTVWLIYVWLQDSHFGSQPDCNHLVKYVIIFVSVDATANWLRILFIIYIVFSALFLLFEMTIVLWRNKTQSSSPVTYAKTVPYFGTFSVGYVFPDRVTVSTSPFLKTLFIRSAVYGVTTLELIVSGNPT